MDTTHKNIMRRTVANTERRFRDRGLEWVRVGWDDCTRAAHSSIGPNISDWSFRTRVGFDLKFLRYPNYTDKTATLYARDISVVVGNETVGGELKAVTLQHYLENYGKYTPGVPEETNLSRGEDEMVTIRFIAVIVPEDSDGTAEVVPTAYSYQTLDGDDPKNIIGASFHLGVGSRTDGSGCEPVYLVKTQDNGSHEDAWFRITNEAMETEKQREASVSCLGTRSTGVGRNRVQCFQIPRLQERKFDWGSAKAAAGCMPEMCCADTSAYRGCNIGNVSYGSSAGRHQIKPNMTYRRDTSQTVTLTFAYYFTTQDGDLSDEEVAMISDTLERSYQDTKAEWVGSLVTGAASPTSTAALAGGVKITPPLKLPNITSQDYLTFNQKITNFPKEKNGLFEFPT